MATGKTYFWYPTQADTTYRELIMEILRGIVPAETFPTIPRIHHVDVEAITNHHRQQHDLVSKDPFINTNAKTQMDIAVLMIDGIWSFLETWCSMGWPGVGKMKDRHNMITAIHFDISGPDVMFTFIYEGKDYINAYIDEDCLRKKVDMKKFRSTVHYAGRGKKN